jgi:hypothetical protein
VHLSVPSLSHAAFPDTAAGRHPHLRFRDLLRLHSRYGPLDCSTAQGGLCHEASLQPVTRLNRSSATRPNRHLSGRILPPLVIRAVGAHVESRRGAGSARGAPVSPPRSSNAACGFPALRSPTGFTPRHTASRHGGAGLAEALRAHHTPRYM